MAESKSADKKDSLKRDALEVNQQFLRGNQPDSFGINTEKPKFPQYAVVSKRTDSYKNWPQYIPLKPDVMIDAGLVYTGVGDSVRCYHCGGGLRNWENGDDPWEEHAKWYPKCPHVVLIKGQKYIDCVARGEKPLETDCDAVLKKPEQKKVTDNELLQTVAAQSCKEYDYSDGIILQAMRLLQSNNKDYSDLKAADILKTIFLIEEKEENEEAACGCDENLYDCCKKTDCEEEDQEEVEKLYQENQRLKENQMCKICLDDVANVIFLPCGHMVSCPRCAPALVKCPLCRLLISGTVKAYFE